MIKNSKIYLDDTNFTKNILSHNGYFCEHFPFCFNSDSLAKEWDNIKSTVIALIKKSNLSTYPISISMSKDDLLRRQVYLPNIFSFLNLAYELELNYEFIKKKCDSKNSESKITYISSFDYPSNYRNSIYSRNARFVGYKYKLKLDISNCFNSIYTHSISWAIVGKEIGKQMANNSLPRNYEYDIGQKIDDANTFMNAKQTNGILTGPFTSRVVSEIILTEIDRILKQKGFDFVRFVDDYNFYFSTKEEAQNAIPQIAKILNEYNLLINREKILIEKYPFDRLENFEDEFKLAEHNENVYQLIQRAYNYATNGNIGALKYLLKLLRGKNLPTNFLPQIYGMLLNTMISFPLLSPYVVNVIEIYLQYFPPRTIRKQLNKLLKNEFDNKHDHETLWLLHIMLKADVTIDKNILKSILVSDNDFAKIMCLDYLTNRYILLGYNNIKEVAKDFSNEVLQLNKTIINSTMFSKNWLLVYTISKLNLRLNNRIKIHQFKNSKFYKVFADNNVDFYQSFYNSDKNEKTPI